MTSIKDDSYIVIQGWMRTELNLTGTKLLVYAAINGFSQDGESECKASIGWFSAFVGASRRSIQVVLSELVKENLIVCIKRNSESGSTNGYKIVPRKGEEGGMQNLRTPKEEEGGGMQNLHTGGAESAQGVCRICTPINKNKDINNFYKESKKEEEEGIPAGSLSEELFSMTDEELAKWYERECNVLITDIETLDAQLEKETLYEEEIARRAREKTTPRYVKDGAGGMKRLKSYDEILTGYGFTEGTKRRMRDFIRHCNASGHFVNNVRLEYLCERISSCEVGDVEEVIERAIRGGYYDFKIE